MKISVNSITITVQRGQSVAAALIAAGIHSWQANQRTRSVFCGIGACHNCLLPDTNIRACQHADSGLTAPETRVVLTASVVIVGAGPAGVAAAKEAAANGAEVVLIDSAPRLGGQYGRQEFDSDYVGIPGVQHLPETVVWAVEPTEGGQRLHLRTGPADAPDRVATVIDTSALVLATGAYDRAIPFPGWDLPGVYTAGAAQALAKGQQVAIGRRVLIAGTGPFLFPVAESLIKVGSHVLGVLEANSPSGWLRDPRGAFAGRGKTTELAGYVGMLARHRIPYRPRTTVIEAHGEDRVTSVTTAKLDTDWNILSGSERRVEVDAVCVGFGFVPQVDLAVAAGCATNADGFVTVDHAQRTSVPGVFAAGEITGIGGAELSAAEGVVAGAAAAQGKMPHRALRTVRRGHKFARALAVAHPILPGWRSWLRPDTLVCRCEEVSYGELCQAVDQRQARDLRSLKLVSRVGLGPCQGRICGRAVAELTGIPETVRRPIAAPIRLGELAGTPLHPKEDRA